MGIRTLQNSFNGGEVSPSLYGRFDDQKYAMGAATVRNFICLPQGPVANRPGFAFVRAAKYAEKAVRLIPFVYSSEQTMALEFGDKYIRFHTEGKTLINEDGTPYEIASPYEEADLFAIHYTQSADVLTLVHPSHAPMELRRYGPYDWRLVEIDFSLGISAPGGLAVVFTSGDTSASGQTNYRPYYRVTALRDDDSGATVESEPSKAVSVACNLYINNSYNTLTWNAVSGAKRYRVYKTYSGVYGLLGETEDTRYVDTNLDTDSSITPPRLDVPFTQSGGILSVTVENGGSGYSNIEKGVVGKSNVSYECVEHYKNSHGGFTTAKVSISDDDRTGTGAKATLTTNTYTHTETHHSEGNSGEADSSHDYTYTYYHTVVTAINITSPGRNYGKPKATINWYDIYGKKVKTVTVRLSSTTLLPTAYATDTTGRGAEFAVTVANGKVAAIRVLRSGQGYTDPKIVIKASVGSGAVATAKVTTTGDYPSAVTYFQQRRVFSGTYTHPRMLWMTASGTESNFTYTIPAQADNRIRFEIAAQEASRVQHVVPLSNLIVLTGSSEFRIQATDGGALTSETISVSPQAAIGASEVQPLVVNSVLVYAANRGGHIRELGYNYQAGGFTTGDLSIRAAHLFDNVKTVDMARMKAPDSILWFVMADGKLLGLTYLPEQGVAAWHRHDTDGAFESVCCVPEGHEDALYAVVRRTINGESVRYIERMHERHFDEISDAFHVDCGGTYSGVPTKQISGLTWLEGETVSILADGGVLPNQVVKDGKVELPVEVTYAHIGLPITAELKTLPVAVQMQDGSYGRGHMKNVNKVFIRVYRSSGISVGPDEDHLTAVKMRGDEPFGEPPQLLSEEIPLAVSPKWTDGGQIVIQQKNPLPITVVSWAADMAQ